LRDLLFISQIKAAALTNHALHLHGEFLTDEHHGILLCATTMLKKLVTNFTLTLKNEGAPLEFIYRVISTIFKVCPTN
jgi:hypothetical protein